jgi:hypothetical protein
MARACSCHRDVAEDPQEERHRDGGPPTSRSGHTERHAPIHAGSFLKEVSAIVRGNMPGVSRSSACTISTVLQQDRKILEPQQKHLRSGASVSDSAEEDLAHVDITIPLKIFGSSTLRTWTGGYSRKRG